MSFRGNPRDAAEVLAYLDEQLRGLRGDTSASAASLQAQITALRAELTAFEAGMALTLRGYIPRTFFHTKGDLLAGLGDGTLVTVPVGTDGQLLYADHTQTAGLRWGDVVAPPGGGPSAGARHIGVANGSTVVSNADVAAITAAVSKQINLHLAPAWNMLGATVAFYPGGVDTIPAGSWRVVVLDNTDQPGAAGYHGEAGDLPFGRVFAKTITDGGGGILHGPGGPGSFGSYCVARALSHEVCEMYVDPDVQLFAYNPVNNRLYALEVGDMANAFFYTIDGVTVSDFAWPSWFDPQAPHGAQFSQANTIPGPFALVPETYDFAYFIAGGGVINGSTVPTPSFEIMGQENLTNPADLYELGDPLGRLALRRERPPVVVQPPTVPVAGS